MKEHFFLCINKANQTGEGGGELLAFATVAEARDYLIHWLSYSCGLSCYTGESEKAALMAENGGELPELSLACPEIHVPKDLEKFTGNFYFDFGGSVGISVFAIHDEASAKLLKKNCIKEFQLDKLFSEDADEILEMFDILINSFSSDEDYEVAREMVNKLIKQEGLFFF